MEAIESEGSEREKPRALSLLASHRPRNVGWIQAAALLFGDWGTSRLYVLGLAFFFAGRSSFWLIVAMSCLVLAVGWAYTHICRLYPDGGGVYAAARRKSEVLSVIGALLLFADYTVTAALSALEAFHYFGLHDAPSILNWGSAGLWACVSILAIGLFNLLGPKHTSGFAIVAAIGMVAVTLIVTFGSLFQISGDQFAHSIEKPSEPPLVAWGHFVAIVLALSGVEAIANLTGVLKQPVVKTASRAIWVVAIEVAVFNVLLAFVMVAASKVLPDVSEHKEDMLAFLSGHYIGVWAEWSVRILGGLLLLSAANTAIGGLIAVMYLLSRDKEAPQPLQHLNRFGVPFIPALLAFVVPAGVLAGVHFMPGESPMLLLAALYAIGVIGAVSINVFLCAAHPRLRKWYRKVPMYALGALLLAILFTLAYTKLFALAFVIAVLTVGLVLRAVTKRLARGDAKPSLLRQAIIEQLPDDIAARPKVLIGTYGSTALAEQAVQYCQQHNAALVVCFVREISLNERVFTEQGRLTIDTDPVALKTFSHFLEKGHERGVVIVPAYDTGNDAATAMAETAALYGADRVIIGSSRKGTLHRIVKGTFQTRLESLLPPEIKVDVLQPQTV
jgi:amino acid transporter